jgi:hypothetical protein
VTSLAVNCYVEPVSGAIRRRAPANTLDSGTSVLDTGVLLPAQAHLAAPPLPGSSFDAATGQVVILDVGTGQIARKDLDVAVGGDARPFSFPRSTPARLWLSANW